MILIDFNGIAIGNIVAQGIGTDENLIRHTILNTLRMYRAKYVREYGEVVICCDGWKNWRKEYFPNYKFKRRETREKSPIDWGTLFDLVGKVKEELHENFPYKVVDVPECEADDVIAQLVLRTQEFGHYEKVMIISADKDFAQLQKFENVSQFSPLKKSLIVEKNPNAFLLEHILKGDGSDGVPNILSDDNVFAEGRRQTPLRKKVIEGVFDAGSIESWEGATESIVRNYQRNETLIDLTKCPEVVKEKIINNYETQDKSGYGTKVLPYLIEKNCKLLIESTGEFINDYR